MLIMNLKTLSRWLLMTEFEMFLNVISFTVFSILLCLRLDFCSNIEDDNNMNNCSGLSLKWFYVFLPLFLVDLLQANFISIVFMRQMRENKSREGIVRLFFSLLFLMTRFLFKFAIYFLVTRSIYKTVKIDSHGEVSEDASNFYYYSYIVKTPFRFQAPAMSFFLHLSVLMFRSCCLKKFQSFS